jgi:hypothetical protein
MESRTPGTKTPGSEYKNAHRNLKRGLSEEKEKETQEKGINSNSQPVFFLTNPENLKKQRSEDEGILTSRFFPTNLEKIQRKHSILDTEYEIPTTTEQPRCLVSIVSHLHGQIPVVICKKETKVIDANFIVKQIPNNNTLSTRLLAPAGEVHLENCEEINEECFDYHSSLRIIYVSRIRLFSNLQCLSQLHIDETEKNKFVPITYLNQDKTGFSKEGLADLAENPAYNKYIHDPNYCRYYSKKNEYIEKVFTSRPNPIPPISIDESLFGFYIDVAIILPKTKTTSIVKVKTFILSNTSLEFVQASHGYINELMPEYNTNIKEELEEFIESGICKLSTIIEAISSYTKNNGVPDGNTDFFLIDLACSVYKSFDDTPRELTTVESKIDIDVDEINAERINKLFSDFKIPENRPEDYLNEECSGYDTGYGLLSFDEIQCSKVSTSEMKTLEKQEYNRIIELLKSKLPDLRMKLAAGSGSLIFNKKQRTKIRQPTKRTRQQRTRQQRTRQQRTRQQRTRQQRTRRTRRRTKRQCKK